MNFLLKEIQVFQVRSQRFILRLDSYTYFMQWKFLYFPIKKTGIIEEIRIWIQKVIEYLYTMIESTYQLNKKRKVRWDFLRKKIARKYIGYLRCIDWKHRIFWIIPTRVFTAIRVFSVKPFSSHLQQGINWIDNPLSFINQLLPIYSPCNKYRYRCKKHFECHLRYNQFKHRYANLKLRSKEMNPCSWVLSLISSPRRPVCHQLRHPSELQWLARLLP